MKKGLIYKLIYGKGEKADFTSESLPKNRAGQFCYVFKKHFGKIFRINLLCGLFALPYLIWDYLLNGYVARVMKGLTVQEQFEQLLRMSLLQFGTEIPMIMLMFVGFAGTFYVIRKLCWGAPIRLINDFGKGIKQCYKQFLLLGFLTGVVNFAFNYLVNLNLLTVSREVEFVYIFALSLTVLATLILFVALVYAMAQSSLYNLSFFRLVKNSFILTFKRLFRSLGVCLLSVLPLLVFRFFPWAFMQIIGGCIVLVIGIGYAVTMQTVLCLSAFDVFINKKSYPKFVNLGLRSGLSYLEAVSDDSEEEESSEDEEENERNEVDEEGETEDNMGVENADNG